MKKIEQSSIVNCFPFAPKYCHLGSTRLSGEIRLKSDGGKSIPNLPLILGADLDFLSERKSFDEAFLGKECVKYSEEEMKLSGSLSAKRTAQVNDLVNFWDVDDKDWFDEDPPEVSDSDSLNGSDMGDYETADSLASYRPAHFFDSHKYGITFQRDQFLKSVCGYISKLQNEDIKKSDLYILIIYHVFAHEVCHSWVEDIVSMIDFELGKEKNCANFYTAAHKRYRGFIQREEAVCETAAHGWVYDCIQKSKCPNVDKLRQAYDVWLRDSVGNLPGYSNYCPSVNEAPIKSQTFIKGLAKLISSRYLEGNHSELCRKVIESYFGGKICRTKKTYITEIKAPRPGTPEFAELSHAHWLKVVPRRVV
jgi:hypothetical protein